MQQLQQMQQQLQQQTQRQNNMIVFGLGNPGAEYEGTRHNVGFKTIEKVAAQKLLKLRKRCFRLYKRADGKNFTLIEPLTYMNNSGEIFPELVKDGEEVVVVVDQMDLPPGKLRIKRGGGSAGHNGLKSIIANYGENFIRIYIGIGRPEEGVSVPDYVLSRPSAEDSALIEASTDRARDAIISLIEGEEFAKLVQSVNSFKA